VYLISDPATDEVFYVGKGTRTRLIQHINEGVGADMSVGAESAKRTRIRDIRKAGHEPRLEVVRHGLSEREAFLIEAALIDCMPHLTNTVAGHDAAAGRTTLDELITRYAAEPLKQNVPPAVIIRLTPPFRRKREALEPGYVRDGSGWEAGMDQETLLDSTRGWWRISPRTIERLGVRHAIPVFEGITRAIYEIDSWIGPRRDGRYAFTARVVNSGKFHAAYVGKWGRHVPFGESSQNPVTYWPPQRAG